MIHNEQKAPITTTDLIYSQVQELGKRMDRLEKRMDKLEERIEKQDAKFEKLSDKIDDLRRDLTGGTQHNQILITTISASLVALVVSLLVK